MSERTITGEPVRSAWSRFGDDGDDWDYGGLWEQAVVNALSGARGQAALADLEAALPALPAPRLIEGFLAKDGEVCAIGALALHNGVPVAELERMIEDEA